MINEHIATFTAHEEYRMRFSYPVRYDPADDGPEIYLIRLEHLALVLDRIDALVEEQFKNF